MNPQITEKTNSMYLLITCAVTVIIIFMYGKINYTTEQFSRWDLQAYRDMASASPRIARNVPKPFAYRILGPYIVGLLPIPDQWGFYVFTIIASISLALMFYLFLCYLGIQSPVAMFTTLLFIFNKWLFGFTVWNYFQVNDVLSLIYIIVLFRAMFKGRWGIFALSMLLGSLTRETSMIMIPVACVYLVEKKRFMDEGKKFIFAVLPAMACFLLLRLLVPSGGGFGLVKTFLFQVNKLTFFEAWFRLLVNSFIPLSFLPAIFSKRTISFFEDKKYMLLFVGLVFVSTLFGSNNERLMAPAFVIFYLLIANIIQEYFYAHKGMLAILMAGTFLSSFHHLFARYPLPSRNITIALAVGSLMVITITSYIFEIVVMKRARKLNGV